MVERKAIGTNLFKDFQGSEQDKICPGGRVAVPNQQTKTHLADSHESRAGRESTHPRSRGAVQRRQTPPSRRARERRARARVGRERRRRRWRSSGSPSRAGRWPSTCPTRKWVTGLEVLTVEREVLVFCCLFSFFSGRCDTSMCVLFSLG